MTKLFNRIADRVKRKVLRWNMTEAEQLLWKEIRLKKLQGCRFRRQFSVKGFVLDFYAPKLKLAIEVDGGIHSREENQIYDKAREQLLNSLGIEFLRFTNDDIFTRMNKLLNIIETKIISILSLTKGEMAAKAVRGGLR